MFRLEIAERKVRFCRLQRGLLLRLAEIPRNTGWHRRLHIASAAHSSRTSSTSIFSAATILLTIITLLSPAMSTARELKQLDITGLTNQYRQSLTANTMQSNKRYLYSTVYKRKSKPNDYPLYIDNDNTQQLLVDKPTTPAGALYRENVVTLFAPDSSRITINDSNHWQGADAFSTYDQDRINYVHGGSALGKLLRMSLRAWWKNSSGSALHRFSEKAPNSMSYRGRTNRVNNDWDYSLRLSGNKVKLKFEKTF